MPKHIVRCSINLISYLCLSLLFLTGCSSSFLVFLSLSSSFSFFCYETILPICQYEGWQNGREKKEKKSSRETSEAIELWTRIRMASAKERQHQARDRSIRRWILFTNLYAKKIVLVLITIEHNDMAATKNREREEKKDNERKKNEWHAINIEDQQYFEQFLC